MTDVGGPAAQCRAPAWWSPWSPTGATLVYAALAIVFTWPLVSALDRSLPWDLGDPALNSWVLAWSADHLLRFVSGHPDAFAGYWNANIFHPEPLALAYSEHLFAQALQVLPVWALTRNPILCYNLVLLSTFVLSGLGAFLLVRDLTGSPRAAFVAGIAFGFAPYRISQLAHVQVLSSAWLPFALYALRRHLATGRPWPLAGFVAAMLLQHLSCGYYVVFFGPFVAAYAAVEIAARRFARWSPVPCPENAEKTFVPGWRTLARVGASFVLIAAGTWPFLSPYLELRRLGFPPRPLPEVMAFSANTWAYLTASPAQWLWGSRIQAFIKPEGELFPGFTVLALAACALIATARDAGRTPADGSTVLPGLSGRAVSSRRGRRRWASLVAVLALIVAAFNLAMLAEMFLWGETSVRVGGVLLRAHVGTALRWTASAAAVLLLVSPRARAVTRGFAASPVSWFLVVVVGAAVLSFGPEIQAGSRTVTADAPYRWMYAHVPGFDGLRVPARYAMLVTLGLAVLCGYGVARVAGRRPDRAASIAVIACAAALVLEGGASPLPLNRPLSAEGFATPPAELPREPTPDVYAAVAALPSDAVLTELPFGVASWDIRYMFASTRHWRRLVNGYSGGFPTSYYANVAALGDVFRDPEIAWRRLVATGSTHVVVHEAAYPRGQGPQVTAWLRAHGARPRARAGHDVLLRLPAAGLE